MGLVSALGVAQVISWGSLFYSIGVLGPAMRAELGVGEFFLFGAFTAGLLVSGALAPLAGRLVDRRGGRYVLCAGSILGAASLALLAVSPSGAVHFAGWLLAGAAMAACLYDPAFATLSQHAGARYRRAVTALTLFGGFASTVFWPLSLVLLEAWGWRATLAIYAAMHLLVCLPIHRFFVPAHAGEGSARAPGADLSPAFADPRLRWLTWSFALATFVATAVATHLVNLLTAAGLTPAQAVSVSMLMGPMQVAGRLVEMGFSHRVRAVTVGTISFVLVMLSLLALISVESFGVAALVFVTAFGCGNGLLTIAKGTAPAELFGARGLGSLLGHMARAGLYARALSPAFLAGVLSLGLTRNAALASLLGISAAGVGSYVLALRGRSGPSVGTEQ